MKRFLLLILCVFLLLVSSASAGTYYVSTSTQVVDGDTFCDGVCDSSDTIIINGGARGNLAFLDFDGDGEYITITNENADPDKQVVITTGYTGQTWGGIELRDCKYVDLRGDNDEDLEYGIKVIEDNPIKAVSCRQESDHIKLSYIDTYGFNVHDTTLTAAWTFDTFEIHHNRVQNNSYSGMYLGHNVPPTNDDPYVANFSVHDNIVENMGCYGITLKGMHPSSGDNYIYNNTIRVTNVDCGTDPIPGSSYRMGMGTQYHHYGGTTTEIYGNRIENTGAEGICLKTQTGSEIHDNIILGAGDADYLGLSNGINVVLDAGECEIYDNIIVQPFGYGIYASSGANTGNTDKRNIICDAGYGERYAYSESRLTEGTGDDANIYEEDCADIGFAVWSDDGNYSNDDFTIEEESTTHYITEAMGMHIYPYSFTPTAQPGDTIIISSDRVSEMRIWFFNGTEEEPFIFTNPEDGTVKINQTTMNAIQFFESSNFSLIGNNYDGATYGIEVDGEGGSTGAIRFWCCKDWEMAYLYVHDATGGLSQNNNGEGGGGWACPITGPWTEDNSIGECRVHHNLIENTTGEPYGESMYFGRTDPGDYPQWVELEIDNNTVRNSSGDGIQAGQTQSLLIHHNYIEDAGVSNTTYQNHGLLTAFEANGAEIWSNTVIRARRQGILMHTESTEGYIHDNLVIDAGYDGLGAGSGIRIMPPDGTTRVDSNTIIGADYYGVETDVGDTTGYVRYNLIVDSGVGGIKSDYTYISDNRIAASEATEYFVSGTDYHLTSQSPAKDAGIGSGYSSTDFDGISRPQGEAADIGAYEYVAEGGGGAGWQFLASNFSYNKTITINQSMVNQSIGSGDFPLLVFITDSDLAEYAQADGDDIVFADSTGSSNLSHEIESWNSTSGELVAWVNISDIKNVSTIRMYYDDPNGENLEDITGTWDSNYKLVHHLQEDPGPGGSGDIVDSTYNNNGTAESSMTSDDLITGIINSAHEYDGTDDYIGLGDSASLRQSSDFTISFWATPYIEPAYGYSYCVISKGGDAADGGGEDHNYFVCFDDSRLMPDGHEGIVFGFENSAGTNYEAECEMDIVAAQSHHVYAVFDDTNNYQYVYVNGTLCELQTGSTGTPATNDQDAYIARFREGTPISYFPTFNGMVDEVRLSSTDRAHAYVETDYNQSAYPDLFISVGEEQGAAPNTKFEYWDGDSWTEGEAYYYLWFTCYWHTPECANAEQSDGQATLKITNNGSLAGTPKMKLNESTPSGINIYVDDDNTFSGAVAMTGSYNAVSTELEPGANVTLWAWATLAGAEDWEFETYATVE